MSAAVRRSLWLAVLLLVAAAIAVPKLVTSERAAERAAAADEHAEEPPPRVEVHTVVPEKLAETLLTTGTLYADERIEVVSEIAGKIERIHFAEGAMSVDQIPLDRFFGPAVVVDVTTASANDPDYQVTVDDFERAEREHGPIGPESIVLIRTGFAKRWPDAASYLGTAARGEAAVRDLHFPGLHPDAARWLVANRQAVRKT